MSFPFDYSQFRNTPYILNYIYAGRLYTVFHEFVTVPATSSVFLHANIGARNFHTISRNVSISENGPLTTSLWEGATFTNGVTPLQMPPRGLDRRIGGASPALTQFFVNPTGVSTVGATLISREKLYAVGNKAPLSFSVANVERALPINSRYLLEFANGGAQAISLTVEILFYESRN